MKATEDESKRSPTRRRLFGPVDHNQNKVDASLIWTNINPGFPRVDYSPRFRPRPVDTDRSTEAGRRDVGIEGEVEMEGDVQTESGVETVDYGRGEPDRRRRSGISSVQSADNFDASLNSIRSWDPNTSWARSDMATTASDLASSGRRPASPTRSSADGSSRRRRPVSEHHPTNDCSTEETAHTGSSSPTSLDPSCRSRPATCPWRTLATRVRDEGRMRSASLGHVSRPSCSRQRSSCRNSTAEGSRGSPDLEPTYKKVPIVQLRGTDVTTVLCPPGQNYFFKPIGGGEESPALTASQSADEGGDDEESSGGTRGSIVESRQGTLASAENDVLEVDNCCLGPERAEEEDQRPGQQQQQERQQQSTRRRRQSTNETDDSLEQEKDDEEEDEVAGHDCSDRDAGNEAARADRTVLMSGRRIKDKLVTTAPKAKKRKPYEDGNSDSPY